MDKSSELIQALKEGKLLSKYYPQVNEKEYLFAYVFQDSLHFECKGWASALGSYTDRLVDIITNPEEWEIDEFEMSKGYPYPWSVLQNKNQSDEKK